MPVKLILLPPIGALIGWLTNRIAIQLLFHPRSPRRIPILGWELQGLLPKRRAPLARAVGEVVEKELFSTGDLVNYLTRPHFRGELLDNLAQAAAKRLDSRIPPFIPRNLRNSLANFARDFVHREAEAILGYTLTEVQERMKSDLFIGSIIEDRLLEIDLDSLEDLILSVASKELLHIEVVGGILGFLIGTLQAVVVLFLG